MITRLDDTFDAQLKLVEKFGEKIEHLDINMHKICWMLKTLYQMHKLDQKKINDLTRQLLEVKE